jgi:hypothetical protein
MSLRVWPSSEARSLGFTSGTSSQNRRSPPGPSPYVARRIHFKQSITLQGVSNDQGVLSGLCSHCAKRFADGRTARSPRSDSGASVQGVVLSQGDRLFDESKIFVE